MDTQQVGSTDVRISRIGLGGFELGPEPDDEPDVENAVAVIRTGIEHGVDWLDTSENYLASANEALIGEALKSIDPDFKVCTKVAPYAALTGGASGFRPEQVHAACRESLRRFGRDHVDMYLLHYPDESGVPLEDTWGAMSELADAGLTRAIGMSNYDIADVEKCHAQRPVDVVQTGLSLLDYLDDRDMIRRCGELAIAVTIYEPLASGLLTEVPYDAVRARWAGTVWEDSAFFQRLLSEANADNCRAVTAGVRQAATRLNATVAQTAIAWVLAQPGVTAAIAGSHSVRHTAENAMAAQVDINTVAADLEALIETDT
jgi:aryl-alcohol dehydrogenase-like predicted oxidoreductase